MATEFEPIIGNWYKNQEYGQLFEVVALDEDDGTIEIQYFESEIEEVDIESWYELSLENAAAPEDWSGPYGDLMIDDYGDTNEVIYQDAWLNPIDEPDNEIGIDYE